MGAANDLAWRQARTVRVRMTTNLGELEIGVFAERAPISSGSESPHDGNPEQAYLC